MKKTILIVAAAFSTFFAVSSANAWMTTNGSASAGATGEHISGYGTGSAVADYAAKGIFTAKGEANADVNVLGGSFSTGNTAGSGNCVTAASDAGAKGFLSTTSASGGVYQTNSAEVSAWDTVASGGNSSTANYSSSDEGFLCSGSEGDAKTMGGTLAHQYNSEDKNTASVITGNAASASGEHTDVSGSGGAMTVAQKYSSNAMGVASNSANFNYSGHDEGAGVAWGSSSVKTFNGAVSASSNSGAKSFAN